MGEGEKKKEPVSAQRAGGWRSVQMRLPDDGFGLLWLIYDSSDPLTTDWRTELTWTESLFVYPVYPPLQVRSSVFYLFILGLLLCSTHFPVGRKKGKKYSVYKNTGISLSTPTVQNNTDTTQTLTTTHTTHTRHLRITYLFTYYPDYICVVWKAKENKKSYYSLLLLLARLLRSVADSHTRNTLLDLDLSSVLSLHIHHRYHTRAPTEGLDHG